MPFTLAKTKAQQLRTSGGLEALRSSLGKLAKFILNSYAVFFYKQPLYKTLEVSKH